MNRQCVKPEDGRATIFVCQACGKRSTSLYGDGSTGWDESCMLNAREIYLDDGSYADPPPPPPLGRLLTFAEILARPIDPELLAEAAKTVAALRRASGLGPTEAAEKTEGA